MKTIKALIIILFMMVNVYGPGVNNQSGIDDPFVNETFPKVQAAVITDIDEANRLVREVMKRALEQVWAIPKVSSYNYTIWWPWIKNYSGEIRLGYKTYFFQWVWIDQELKKSMGY